MSRHGMKALLFLTVAVLFTATVALAAHAKTVNIYMDAVLPTGEQLKAGKYQVTVDEAAQQVTFKQSDKTVATAACKIVEKQEKNSYTEARFGQKDNKPLLEEIRLGGENRSIVLNQ